MEQRFPIQLSVQRQTRIPGILRQVPPFSQFKPHVGWTTGFDKRGMDIRNMHQNMIAKTLNIYSRENLGANYLKMPSSDYVICHSPVYNFSKGKSKCNWFIILNISHYEESFIKTLYEIKLTQPCGVVLRKPLLHFLKKSCSDYVIYHSPVSYFKR